MGKAKETNTTIIRKKSEDMEVITAFTDGACSKNPGPGGWASIISIGDEVHIVKNYCLGTTNNRMELTAVIETLKYLKKLKKTKAKILITSDSSYVINAINKNWIDGWQKKNWKNSKGYNVKNKELWEQLIKVMSYFNNLTFNWCKGHAGNPMNELADKEAVSMTNVAIEKSKEG